MTAEWVTHRYGITVRTSSPASPVRLALRRNPARAQLLVSPLLGKHVPVAATDVLATGQALGRLVAAICAAPAVLGFAETATALGHAVAAAVPASTYAATTRRPTPAAALAFREEHSHAVDQTVAALPPGDTLVLVDDELSTGRTAGNVIRAVHARSPRSRYVLAQLLDSRTPQQRAALTAAVTALGAELVSISLVDAEVTVPADAAAAAAALAAAVPEPDWTTPPPPSATPVAYQRFRGLPVGVWRAPEEARAQALAARVAAALPVHRDARTLVLGDEELLYLPQLIAAALGPRVRTSATTRSPAVAHDAAGYPLRTVLRFPATHEPGRPSQAYNVAPSARPDRGEAPGFNDLVLVTDAPGEHRALVGRLRAVAGRSVTVVGLRP